MDEKLRQRYAELVTKAALQKARIESDPTKFLIQSEKRINELEKLLKEIEYIATGQDNLKNTEINFINISSELSRRLTKILNLIHENKF